MKKLFACIVGVALCAVLLAGCGALSALRPGGESEAQTPPAPQSTPPEASSGAPSSAPQTFDIDETPPPAEAARYVCETADKMGNAENISLYPDGFFIFLWYSYEAGEVSVYGDYVESDGQIVCTPTDGGYYQSKVYGFVQALVFERVDETTLRLSEADTLAENSDGVGYAEPGALFTLGAPLTLPVQQPRLLGNYTDASAQAQSPITLSLSESGRFNANLANLQAPDLAYQISGEYVQQGDQIVLTLASWLEKDYPGAEQTVLTFEVQDNDHLVYRGEPVADLQDGTLLSRVRFQTFI